MCARSVSKTRRLATCGLRPKAGSSRRRQRNPVCEGFLAWAAEAPVVGSNLALVWYQHEPDGTWTMWAWDSGDLAVATIYLRNELDDDTLWALDPSINDALAANPSAAPWPPEQVVNGLFIGDPMQAVVPVSPDPPEVLAALAEGGWEVAPALSELEIGATIPCQGQSLSSAQVLLDDMAAKASCALFGVSSTSTCSWPCDCSTILGTPTCGAWTFSFSVTESSGSKVCHYTRSCTNTYTNSGKWWYCLSCAGTGTVTYTEHGRTTSLPGDPCTPPPP